MKLVITTVSKTVILGSSPNAPATKKSRMNSALFSDPERSRRAIMFYNTIMKDTWLVYILLCSDNTYYVGSTNDLDKRVARHNSGDGAKYTRGRRPLKIAWFEACASRSEALIREMQIKKWTREKKEKLIVGQWE